MCSDTETVILSNRDYQRKWDWQRYESLIIKIPQCSLVLYAVYWMVFEETGRLSQSEDMWKELPVWTDK